MAAQSSVIKTHQGIYENKRPHWVFRGFLKERKVVPTRERGIIECWHTGGQRDRGAEHSLGRASVNKIPRYSAIVNRVFQGFSMERRYIVSKLGKTANQRMLTHRRRQRDRRIEHSLGNQTYLSEFRSLPIQSELDGCPVEIVKWAW